MTKLSGALRKNNFFGSTVLQKKRAGESEDITIRKIGKRRYEQDKACVNINTVSKVEIRARREGRGFSAGSVLFRT